MSEQLGFRAHARLLTMLGEQLIKNERVALVELVKNAYDADATRVTVDFRGFGADFSNTTNSSIVITDNGVGMTTGLVRTAWMNPATPSKKLVKANEPKTVLGRVLQGEKGIGRFATFKLGSEVTLVTRARDSAEETTLVVDISVLDEDAGIDESVTMDLFLEDIPAILDVDKPRVFVESLEGSSRHGTSLSISKVRSKWTEQLIEGAFTDLDRMQPLMWGESAQSRLESDFDVVFLRDGVDLNYGRQRNAEFEVALDRAVLKIRDGVFDSAQRLFRFDLNGRSVTLSIDGTTVRALKPFKDHFLKAGKKDLPVDHIPHPSCGSFGFEFYIFDRSPDAPTKNSLDADQRQMIKDHRIYLYRDGLRVYPYGDKDDDWLEIDIDRGTESAGRTLSNDQTVGYISITQAENPRLRDKTSREGLIDDGSEVSDFKALVKTLLRYLRQQYQPHLDAKARTKRRDLQQHRIDENIEALRLSGALTPRAVKHLDALEKALDAERQLSMMQVSRTEQLAGVGLSVETASHDLILAGVEALRTARQVLSELELLDHRQDPIYAMAAQLVSRLEFISARFRDVQGLFVSTRQKQSEQDVIQALKRVRAIYSRLHAEKSITLEIDDAASLRASSTEAAVLQLLINLVDNSTYWLSSKLMPPGEARIIRAFTPSPNVLVFTDNGPGVSEEDAPFIFEPFYSGKGEDGKGLGLYIAHQNAVRNGFSIRLERTGSSLELEGATFVIRFGTESEVNVDS